MNEIIRLGNHDRFAVFRLPDSGDVRMFISDAQDPIVLQKEHFKTPGYVLVPFTGKAPSYFIPADRMYANPQWSFQSSGGQGAVSMDQNRYLRMVREGIAALSDDFPKVILSRPLTVELKERDAAVVFYRMCKKYPSAFVFMWHTPETGTWMGATPEPLLRQLDENRFLSVALAGTRPLSASGKPWGRKELEEHQWVVRFIAHSLNDMDLAFSKGQRHTVRAGMVEHLRTDFMVDTPPVAELVHRLHPTPAVCGLPRKQAHTLISRLEGYPREYYTGFSGPVGVRTELFVSLRCMKWYPKQACLYIGGGITRQSIPSLEWKETQWKAKTLLKVLNKA